MSLLIFPEIIQAMKPRVYEVVYALGYSTFRIEGVFKEVIFYDELEPETDSRLVIKTALDEFDIEISSIVSFKLL